MERMGVNAGMSSEETSNSRRREPRFPGQANPSQGQSRVAKRPEGR